MLSLSARLNSLRPKKYKAHYPRWMVGKPLLVASSALASLGDAMFGYSQGIIAGIQVQPSFLERMYGVKNVTVDQIANGQVVIDPFVEGTISIFHRYHRAMTDYTFSIQLSPLPVSISLPS